MFMRSEAEKVVVNESSFNEHTAALVLRRKIIKGATNERIRKEVFDLQAQL
jgi:hypothetical protein